MLGGALQTAAVNINYLYAGRVLAGVGVGQLVMIIPLYQSELAHPSIRGRIGGDAPARPSATAAPQHAAAGHVVPFMGHAAAGARAKTKGVHLNVHPLSRRAPRGRLLVILASVDLR